MRLEAVELRRVALPLVQPLRASWGTESARDVLVVRAITDEGEGWGECVAMSEPRYSPEYVDAAHRVVRDHLVPLLVGREITGDAVADRLAVVRGHPMAKASLEAAILDAELQAAGTRLVDHLGGTTDAVPAGAVVGLADSVDELVDTVARHVEAGYQRVKLKVVPGWDDAPVAVVRERFGDVALQVDANGAYSLDDVERLQRLDAFDLLLIEQPLADDDLLGHAELARQLRTPICLDESITSVRAVETALALGACSVVCVKPGRLGGLLAARRVHDHCLERDVPAWVGGMLETGIGRAANVALATLPGFTLVGDLSASDRYFAQDLTEPFVLEDGHLAVPAGPGIGVVPDPDVLDEVTTQREVVSAG